ncbi:hypothetical protein [Ramlibacter sp.]|uniref:hypothetical protein n=1 Tax=Ramlibacter sp. TaxID=1917967 RepID=UPI003D13E202
MNTDFATASAGDIASAFEDHLNIRSVDAAERADAIAAARAAAALWCFLRDDGQLEPTAASLVHFARFGGPSSVRHHLQRRDIPKGLIEAARRAFVSEPGAAKRAAAWDDRLHGSFFAPFALGGEG